MFIFFSNFIFFLVILINRGFYFCCNSFFRQGPFEYHHYWNDMNGLDRYSLNLPDPVTPVMLGIHSLHNHILFFMGVIFSVVAFLLFSILYYFSFYPDRYYRLSYYANCIRRFFDNLYVFLFANFIWLLNSLKVYTSTGSLSLFSYIAAVIIFPITVAIVFVLHSINLIAIWIKDYAFIKIFYLTQYSRDLLKLLHSFDQRNEYTYYTYMIETEPFWVYRSSHSTNVKGASFYFSYMRELTINYIYALRVVCIYKFFMIVNESFNYLTEDIESSEALAYFSSVRFMKTFVDIEENPFEDEGEIYGNKIRWLTYLTKHRQYRVTHNLQLEVIWTLIPTLILIIIAVPSFALLYSTDELLDVSLNIKVIGHQWYWSYEYSDLRSLVAEDIKFDSYMIPDSELSFGDLRLLKTDCPLILPKETNIRFLITSTDVLHSWAVPSFGIKMDAVPGRLNQTSAYIMEMGRFYGQCSELCGVNHGFMPIEICVIEPKDYYNWLFLKHDLSIMMPAEEPAFVGTTSNVSPVLDRFTSVKQISFPEAIRFLAETVNHVMSGTTGPETITTTGETVKEVANNQEGLTNSAVKDNIPTVVETQKEVIGNSIRYESTPKDCRCFVINKKFYGPLAEVGDFSHAFQWKSPEQMHRFYQEMLYGDRELCYLGKDSSTLDLYNCKCPKTAQKWVNELELFNVLGRDVLPCSTCPAK